MKNLGKTKSVSFESACIIYMMEVVSFDRSLTQFQAKIQQTAVFLVPGIFVYVLLLHVEILM